MTIAERIKKMTRTRREKLWDDLCKLQGYPPHNDFGNIVMGDGYFARSLEQKYQMTGEELEAAFQFLLSQHGGSEPARAQHFREVLPVVDTQEEPPKLQAVPDENWGKKDAPRKRVRPKPGAKWGTNTPKRYEASYHIDPHGDLMTRRAGRYVHQPCPHAGRAHCGDACSHFREPVFREAQVHIAICMGTVLTCHVKNFNDDRPEETE